MDITIYHNPRCSKSRKTLELIRQAGIEPVIVEYLNEPPDAATLEDLCSKLERRAVEIARKGEDAWQASGLDNDATDADVIALMVEHPIVIERPIVVRGDRAVLGRPPENVLTLLDA